MVFREVNKKEEMECNLFFGCNCLFPYILHFGEKGITHKVTWINTRKRDSGKDLERAQLIVSPTSLYVERVKGDNLGYWFSQIDKVEELSQMYEKLGCRVGYIHKYSVYHNHLKTENVVVDENDNPVIYDWKWGGRIEVDEKETYHKFPNSGDSVLLLRTIRDRLIDKFATEKIAEFEDLYKETRRKELNSLLETTIEEIEQSAEQFILTHSN